MKKKEFLSCLVGLLMGIVFSIPFVLVYTFLSLLSGYFAILIVIGVVLGYKMINKEIYNTKSTRIYLILAPIFIMLFDILVFAPSIVQFVSQRTVTIKFLGILYSSKYVITAFIIDLIKAIIMVLIPSLLIPMDLKKDGNNLSNGEEFILKIESIFKKHNAFSKETAVDKKIIKEDIRKIEMNKIKRFFYTDLINGPRIKSKKGKWYFKKKKNKFYYSIFLSILLIIFYVSILKFYDLTFGYKIRDNVLTEIKQEQTKNIEFKISDKLSIKMPECMILNEKDYDNSDGYDYYYYQYLSSDVSKTDLKALEVIFFDNYNIYDYYTDFNELKDALYDYNKKFNIIENGQINWNNNMVDYYKMDSTSTDAITYCYIIPLDNGFIILYTYWNKENFADKNKDLSDNIIKSLRIININNEV